MHAKDMGSKRVYIMIWVMQPVEDQLTPALSEPR